MIKIEFKKTCLALKTRKKWAYRAKFPLLNEDRRDIPYLNPKADTKMYYSVIDTREDDSNMALIQALTEITAATDLYLEKVQVLNYRFSPNLLMEMSKYGLHTMGTLCQLQEIFVALTNPQTSQLINNLNTRYKRGKFPTNREDIPLTVYSLALRIYLLNKLDEILNNGDPIISKYNEQSEYAPKGKPVLPYITFKDENTIKDVSIPLRLKMRNELEEIDDYICFKIKTVINSIIDGEKYEGFIPVQKLEYKNEVELKPFIIKRYNNRRLIDMLVLIALLIPCIFCIIEPKQFTPLDLGIVATSVVTTLLLYLDTPFINFKKKLPFITLIIYGVATVSLRFYSQTIIVCVLIYIYYLKTEKKEIINKFNILVVTISSIIAFVVNIQYSSSYSLIFEITNCVMIVFILYKILEYMFELKNKITDLGVLICLWVTWMYVLFDKSNYFSILFLYILSVLSIEKIYELYKYYKKERMISENEN